MTGTDGKQAPLGSVVKELMKPQFSLPGDEPVFYSYGLMGYKVGGVDTISHGGVSRGYGATIFFAPVQRYALVVLTNSNGQTLPRTRQKFNQLFLPLKPDAGDGSPKKFEAADETQLRKYAGKFRHEPQTWEFLVRDGKFYLKLDGSEHELRQTDKDTFGYPQGEFLFVANSKGNFQHVFMGLYAARRVE